MKMYNKSSSTLSAIGYDSDANILLIKFKNGDLFEYHDVPQYVFKGLMNSESVDSYILKILQDNYFKYRLIF